MHISHCPSNVVINKILCDYSGLGGREQKNSLQIHVHVYMCTHVCICMFVYMYLLYVYVGVYVFKCVYAYIYLRLCGGVGGWYVKTNESTNNKDKTMFLVSMTYLIFPKYTSHKAS